MKCNKAQNKAVLAKYRINPDKAKTFMEFRRRVVCAFGLRNVVTMKWCGMWLAIEQDGYTHS